MVNRLRPRSDLTSESDVVLAMLCETLQNSSKDDLNRDLFLIVTIYWQDMLISKSDTEAQLTLTQIGKEYRQVNESDKAQ